MKKSSVNSFLFLKTLFQTEFRTAVNYPYNTNDYYFFKVLVSFW